MSRGLPAHRAGRAAGSSAAWSRSRATSATSRSTTRTSTVSLLRFSNVLGPDIVTPLSKALRMPAGAVGVRVRPPLPVRARGRRRPLDAVRRRRTACPASSTSPATACCPGARSPGSAASAPWPCPSSVPGSPRPGCGPSASTSRPSSSSCSSTGGASTTAGSRRRASSTASPRPVPCRPTSRRCASRAPVGHDPEYQYQEAVENFFRHSPAIVRDRPVEPT